MSKKPEPTVGDLLRGMKVKGVEGAAVMDRAAMRAEALDRTAATPKQFLLGHSPLPRFYTEKKLPPFEEFEQKFRGTTSAMLLDRSGKKVNNVDAGRRIPYANASKVGAENFGRVLEWDNRIDEGAKLEPPGGSGWHKLVEAYEAGKVFSISSDPAPLFVLEAFIGHPPQIFVIEHDWGAAFAGATDIEDGEYYLPYQHCAFEYRMCGNRVITSALDIDEPGEGKIGDAMLFVEGSGGCWYCSTMGSYRKSENADPSATPKDKQFSALILDNIRALCIGLDAEVIEREVVRAPIKLNQARERSHKAPLPDHSVVRLANRSRVAPLESHSGDGPRWHPRLHFVRGHWRHFTDHKTWIRWHLRGNPDLGFIDKHYRA